MLPRRSSAVRAAVLASAAAASVGAVAVPSLGASAAVPDVVMTANVLPGIDHVAPTGTAAPTTPMTVAVGVARPHPAAEDALLRALYDPRSAQYHRFPSVAEFDARFGVPQATRDRLTSWLRGGGLQVDSVSGAGDLVVAEGTAQQVSSLFRVGERTYRVRGADFVANDTAPTVPGGLGITTVVGLNSLQRATLPDRRARAASPAQNACLPVGACIGTLQVEDLWSLYDLPAEHTGKGQRIAILGEGVLGSESEKGSVIADLRQFENEHHLPHVPVTVHCVIAGDCGADTLGSGEWDLDSQSSTGMAPGIDHLDFYFARDLTDAGQAAMIAGWLSDPAGGRQANASFAECEQAPYNASIYGLPGNVDGNGGIQVNTGMKDPVLGLPLLGPTGHQLGNDLEAYAEPALESAAIMGRTLFASAGDTGTGCTAVVADGIGPNGVAPEPYPLNPYPAGSRYAVAVGGTVLYTDGATPPKRVVEYAWPYTGGGSSPFLTAPDYQQNVPNLTGTCVVDENGGTGATGALCRGVPDIAALSGDTLSNGFAVVMGGSDTVSGGTSLSSPLNVGMWARIQEASGAPAGLGFANDTYYGIGKDPARYARDFVDITVGANGVYGCPSPAGGPPGAPCVARAGWDYVSGWGVPDVAHVIADLPAPTATGNVGGPGGGGSGAAPSPAVPVTAGAGAAASLLPNTAASTSGAAVLAGVAASGVIVAAMRRRRRRVAG